MKYQYSIYILFYFAFIPKFNSIYAQDILYLSFEQGLSYNVPLHFDETIYSIPSSTTSFEIFRKNYTTRSYFSKIALETRFINRNSFSIYFVSGIGYIENKNTYRDSGYIYGCFGWGEIKDSVNNVNQSLGIPIGLKMMKAKKKFTMSSSISLNPMIQFYSRSVIYDFNNGTYTETNNNSNGLKLFLSGQISFQYKFNRNFAFGPSIEFFSPNLLLGNGIYFHTKYFFLNPGLKLNLLLK